MNKELFETLESALSLNESAVSFREFVTSPEFCDNHEVYEYWLSQGMNMDDSYSELILDGSLGGGKCQSGDTWVLTSDGLRRLGSFVGHSKEDESVPTTDSVFINGAIERLSYKYCSGVKPTKVIKTSSGKELKCSFHHPYKVWNGSGFSWKRAEELKVGDLLRVDLTPMPIKDVVKASILKWKWYYRGIWNYEEWEIDEDLGYFLGLMAGDGSYTNDITFESVDLELVNWVSNYLGRDFSIDKRNPRLKIFHLNYLRGLYKTIGSWGQNSSTKKISKVIENAPWSVQVSFVQGLMDTDGTVDSRGHVSIDLNSKELLKFVQVVANGLGIQAVFRKSRAKSYRLALETTNRCKKIFRLKRKLERVRDSYSNGYSKGRIQTILIPGLRELLKKVKKERGLSFTREQRKRCSYLGLNNEFNTQSWKECAESLRNYGLEVPEMYNMTLEKVTSIEESKEMLYDITNPISHSYRANGIESHNTTYSCYWLGYRIYLLFLGGNPQKQLDLSKDTEIYVIYFSVSMPMAKKSGLDQIWNMFNDCKWFRNNYPIDEQLKSEVKFPNRFHISYGSSTGHQIGLSVWGFILDEANFKSGVGQGNEAEYAEVTELYEQLCDRLMSRFSRPDGSINGLAILISSASYQSSFVEKRKLLALEDPHTKVITSTAYEVKPWQYSKERFEVFIGCGEVEPRIIENEEQKNFCLRTAKIAGTGQEETYFRKVPLNLKKSFITNIYRALQNHCGVPTMVSGRFMSNLKYLYSSYVEENEIPPILQSFKLQAVMEDDTELIEYLIEENIMYPERPHSMFLDLSVQSDTGGLSLWRYDGKNEKGADIHTRVFLLKIEPPQYPNSTSITKVKNFIIDMAQVINLVAFGSDQYQSTQLRQEVQTELELPDIRMSLDSSDLAYIHWQRALVDGRIRQIKDAKLEKECTEAIHDLKRHRVIKGSKSSDDVLQVEVGGFYLSDTVGKNQAVDISDLYQGSRLNLVGTRSQRKLLQQLGYTLN